ncbi:hypothetical protein ANFP_29250 [Acidithiobacillus ferrooxidans]|nr:hypothetical protein ANFP_29250 [Acidithiobacillus ferrooxidans]
MRQPPGACVFRWSGPDGAALLFEFGGAALSKDDITTPGDFLISVVDGVVAGGERGMLPDSVLLPVAGHGAHDPDMQPDQGGH